MKEKRLLFAFPHPDDESLGPGGTIAKYAREGVEVHYVCATRGEVGSVESQMLKPYAHLAPDQQVGALREQELRNAADILGLTGVHHLDYRDSGMTGWQANKDPRAFINADPVRVTGQLVKIIRLYQPQVIVTFDPFGGYGHPDHIFIHQRTTEAFHAAGDQSRYPEAGRPYQPQKLYWTVCPKRLTRIFMVTARLTLRSLWKYGRNKDIDTATHDYPATTLIDIGPYYDIKQQAWRCHASQFSQFSQFSAWPSPFGKFQKFFESYETFRLVEPDSTGKRVIENDLFEGVAVSVSGT